MLPLSVDLNFGSEKDQTAGGTAEAVDFPIAPGAGGATSRIRG